MRTAAYPDTAVAQLSIMRGVLPRRTCRTIPLRPILNSTPSARPSASMWNYTPAVPRAIPAGRHTALCPVGVKWFFAGGVGGQ